MPGLSFILQTLVEHCEIKRQALPSLPKDSYLVLGQML